MTSIPAYTLTHESLTIIWEGKSYTVQKGAPNFLALRMALLSEKWEDIPKNLTIAKSIEEWAKGAFTVNGSIILFNNVTLPEPIATRIKRMVGRGENPTPVFKFYERLQKNPSYRSVHQLWGFMTHQGIPLTADGCFLAYKAVDRDYKDNYSKKFNNRPGEILEMPRNKISDDPEVACHDGFHVGALAYAQSFGNADRRIMICKVDPENVVCVPHDESQKKMRVCKYEVIGEHNGEPLPSTVFIPENDDLDEDDVDDQGQLTEDHQSLTDPPKVVDLMHQEADAGLMPVEPKKEKKTKEPKKDDSGYEVGTYRNLNMAGLLECSLSELRWYAAKELKIVGASKIPGGKVALVDRIMKVRE